VPPEQLLCALLLQALYSIRSERQPMEPLDYNVRRSSDLHFLEEGNLTKLAGRLP
jgi:hypothetical protein